MLVAITREVSSSINQCELTELQRQPIDVERARHQHRNYNTLLAKLGCQVFSLPEEPQMPDSVFVEDAALVLDEIAIITNPGAPSRRLETERIARELRTYRPLSTIAPPATVDGGDILRIDKTIYVGLSSRSNPEAIRQMQQILSPFGYCVQGVAVNGCLHLKSAVTQVARDTLLINPAWIDATLLPAMSLIEIDPNEPGAANALCIGDSLVFPAQYPLTASRLRSHGLDVQTVDISELVKAEGAVTCCSLIFEAAPTR
jgi:dimethylargininase